MVLKAENGKETITFSSVAKPVATVSSTPEPGRCKKPSKVKKDIKRKKVWLEKRSQGKEKASQTGEISILEEAWLEKRRQRKEKASQTDEISILEEAWFKSTAELEYYTHQGFVRSDQIGCQVQ